MKHLILSFCMILCFGFASAQETPVQKKQSTDTIHQKKSKHNTSTQKNSNTKKGDTVNKQRTDKKGKTVKSAQSTTPQRKDSINGTKP
ncbi:hypothetical protein L1276_000412 [Flavobacterium sp. HSC-32F16]|uniref:hypothetical protein n=1 Tax=Flavobacterium sp. HSC-32F16 TaxID=2910964 RepID=UPI0020A5ED0E|nr:hypothetical protein [Flavobacterium sp. HSC-32F16]MCP2025272.1 hypothetical protein [Flavobacterium sp. HSC-32F16]